MTAGQGGERDGTYRTLKRRSWIILPVLAAGGYLLLGPGCLLGVILGGLIIIANFSALHYTVSNAFSVASGSRVGKAVLILKAYFRLLLLGVVLYVLITRGWVDPVGLTVGLSTVFLSIFSFGISRMLKDRSEEAV